MHKYIFIFLLVLTGLSPAVYAQDFEQCQARHHRILTRYHKQVTSNVTRIINGLSLEESQHTDKRIMALYKRLAAKYVLKAVLISQLKTQLNRQSLEELYGNPKTRFLRPMVFNTDEMKFDMTKKFKEILSHNSNIPAYLLEEYEHELLKETVKVFGKNLYASMMNGLVGKIISGSATKALTVSALEQAFVSFGAHVIKGAGIAAVVNIVKKPLMGSRPTPEHIWFEILEAYPEFIINPQWMRDAGSYDHPWLTHCRSIHNQEYRMQKVANRLINDEENNFISQIKNIERKRNELKLNDLYEKFPELKPNKANVADKTYVESNIQVEELLPLWAR